MGAGSEIPDGSRLARGIMVMCSDLDIEILVYHWFGPNLSSEMASTTLEFLGTTTFVLRTKGLT